MVPVDLTSVDLANELVERQADAGANLAPRKAWYSPWLISRMGVAASVSSVYVVSIVIALLSRRLLASDGSAPKRMEDRVRRRDHPDLLKHPRRCGGRG